MPRVLSKRWILKKIRSQVGLSSIPCWCMPHHVLSTGQAYRATLARQLQHAAATGEVLLLRNFATVLDPLSGLYGGYDDLSG